MGSNEAWLFTADDGPEGRLVLRPLTTLPAHSLETAVFASDSPFTVHLRQKATPLIQYDMDALESFDQLPVREKEILSDWQRVLYMPLKNGNILVGVVALGGKQSGEPYDHQDYEALQAWCTQVSPLLAQARNMASLRHLNDYVMGLNQKLVRQNQHLRESVKLYGQYIDLVSPELRRPFTTINSKLQKLQESSSDDPARLDLITGLNQEFIGLRQPIDMLINLATRVQVRREFDFQLVHLDEVLQRVIRSLSTMAEARRVSIEYEPERNLPPVLADSQQLQEAIHNLIHNAIKFNKIGGRICLETGVEGSDLYLKVADTGVGIPEERLSTLWSGLAALNANGGSKKRPSMGLALAHFIVAAHSGRMQVVSQYGSGSTFSLYLPLVFDD
ncbi:MAG: hypothetical protein H6661_06800 [Ardenticatenaceae bacterium]|nr:hypothetical protein [Ardenticatenaceae bacterium]